MVFMSAFCVLAAAHLARLTGGTEISILARLFLCR